MAKRTSKTKRPNILLIAIDSLRRDHMSCYGYHRLTTPYIDDFAEQCTLFEQTFSPHIPTTSAYASMLTGRDCFGTEVVALRHKGGLTKKVTTLPELLRQEGYNTTCVGFGGNPSSRGFSRYLEYEQWGSWANAPLAKADLLNQVALPELDRLSRSSKPWFVMLRHMDPHAPYLPPPPYNQMFYSGDPTDKKKPNTIKPAFDFKPFADFFKSWMMPGLRDADWVDAQYDGAIAYMDACIQVIFQRLEEIGVIDDTIVALNGDHGETLQEHTCWFDHHGTYDPTLVVPLMIRYPRKVPMGLRIPGINQHKDLVPTLLDLAGVKSSLKFDGRSLMKLVRGQAASFESEFYITECTWMRKHGWRTPQWKYIEALEPDFHFLDAVELYDLVEDPLELNNLARKNPDVVATLRDRMNRFIAKREKQLGITNPMLTQGDWNAGAPFASSREAYAALHIGDSKEAKRIQAMSRK
ncbi:MAG: sulfatase [Planctomycetaceae bacterium]|nr:sulfatase [Planctomycetaceae bacterium]